MFIKEFFPDGVRPYLYMYESLIRKETFLRIISLLLLIYLIYRLFVISKKSRLIAQAAFLCCYFSDSTTSDSLYLYSERSTGVKPSGV